MLNLFPVDPPAGGAGTLAVRTAAGKVRAVQRSLGAQVSYPIPVGQEEDDGDDDDQREGV